MDAWVDICRGKQLWQAGDSHNRIQTSGMMVMASVVTMELMVQAMISTITQWRSMELLVITLGHGNYLCTNTPPLQCSAADKPEFCC